MTSTPSLLVGETRTGRITATVPCTGKRWTATLNNSGSIDGVTIPGDVVEKYGLRQLTHGNRSFLAVERGGRIKQAGPIRSRSWDWEKGELTLGAAGLWGLLDQRKVEDDATYPSGLLTFSGVSLGGLAVSLVSHMVNHIPPYTNLPIVLPSVEVGDHEESFARWEVPNYGEQLRQITQRATDAPDIRFQPRRRADDPRYLEWVMEVGTLAQPSLFQGGPDWVFDSSAPRSPVRGISTDEDATQMAQQVWATGNGSEADMKLAVAGSLELLDLGWPLTEVDESHSTVDDYPTLIGHANNLLARSNRPIEVFKVSVSADAANEVQPGDYARVITKGDKWLGDMDRTMRVRQVSGDLSDTVMLEMFPMAGLL